MAAEDLANYKQDTRDFKTAQQVIVDGNNGPQALQSDVDNAAAAEAAGVKDASFINYAVALEAYEDRPDIENLANRRARDFPVSFADAAFMRQTGYGGGSSGV